MRNEAVICYRTGSFRNLFSRYSLSSPPGNEVDPFVFIKKFVETVYHCGD